jgi:hypothetical protein
MPPQRNVIVSAAKELIPNQRCQVMRFLVSLRMSVPLKWAVISVGAFHLLAVF